jgi:hypothetical protein
MTDYDAADLLSRLRADRAGVIEARRLTLGRHFVGPDASVLLERSAAPEYGEAVSMDERTDLKANGRKEATSKDDRVPEGVAAAQLDGDLVADEEIGLLRAIRAKADRVDARLESLQAWVAETRSWIETFETAHRTHSDLGRIVLESQARIESHTRIAEERAGRIITEATEQARQLLAAAEIAAAEIISANADLVDASPALDDEFAAVETSTRPETPVMIEVSAEDAAALYEVIDLFTRMNTELLNELNALVGAIPRRSSG